MKLDDLTIREFLDSLAAKTPTPGGGAVAGLLAALSAALAQMVVNFSIGKKKLAEHDALHQQAMKQLRQLSEQSLALAEADTKAYSGLNALLKLDKSDPQRMRELPRAVDEANEPAWQVMLACHEALTLLRQLCGRTNALLRSDLAIAAILAEAAARAAWWNILINMPLIADEQTAGDTAQRVGSTLSSIQSLAHEIENACKNRD